MKNFSPLHDQWLLDEAWPKHSPRATRYRLRTLARLVSADLRAGHWLHMTPAPNSFCIPQEMAAAR